MRKGNVLFFKVRPRATSSDARVAGEMSYADDPQGIVLDRFNGALLCLPQTWRRLLVLPPSRHTHKAAVLLPNLLHDPESIIVLDLKTEVFTVSSSWRRRPPSLHLV
jgi:type IV secretory pathway TraG/TraD family ATPase VirD4